MLLEGLRAARSYGDFALRKALPGEHKSRWESCQEIME
jgi:hypothetical protein